MRNRFDNQLAEMNNELISMGGTVRKNLRAIMAAAASIDRSTAANAKNIDQMAQATIKMVTDSLDAFVRRDLTPCMERY